MQTNDIRKTPMVIMVAPNGARKGYSDHPALPLTADELADTAVRCARAGANAIHVHVRDGTNDFAHCLNATRYAAAFQAIESALAAIGETLFLQATTEAVGQYQADEQMAMVRELATRWTKPFGVSLAVRELLHESVGDNTIHDFFSFLRDNTILPQLICYDESDRQRFQQLLSRSVLPGRSYPCLFVLGRYSQGQQSNPADLLPFFSDLSGISQWMVCAFGAREADVATASAPLGGDMRIGFENNMLLKDATLADDNAALIAQTTSELSTTGRCLANFEQTVSRLSPDWL